MGENNKTHKQTKTTTKTKTKPTNQKDPNPTKQKPLTDVERSKGFIVVRSSGMSSLWAW